MERQSVVLENVPISEEPSPESLSASVDASVDRIQPCTPGAGNTSSTDRGYTKPNSSADSSTQTEASGGSSPSGYATVVIKEGYVLLISRIRILECPDINCNFVIYIKAARVHDTEAYINILYVLGIPKLCYNFLQVLAFCFAFQQQRASVWCDRFSIMRTISCCSSRIHEDLKAADY